MRQVAVCLSKTLASLWNSTKMQVFTSKQLAFKQMKWSLGLSTGIDRKVRGSSSVVCTSNSSCSSEHVHYCSLRSRFENGYRRSSKTVFAQEVGLPHVLALGKVLRNLDLAEVLDALL